MLKAPPLFCMHTAIAAPKMMMKEMPPSVLPKLLFMVSITLPSGMPEPSASARDTANSDPKTLNFTLEVRKMMATMLRTTRMDEIAILLMIWIR